MENRITIETQQGTFGAGYSSFLFGDTGNTALTTASTSDSNVRTSDTTSTSQMQISVATSVQELVEQLSAHAAASGAVMGVHVAGSASFLERTLFAANQTYVVARVYVETQIKSLEQNNLVITDDAAALPPDEFITRYGDLYVGELHFGGMLTLIFTVSSPDLESKASFDATASASVGSYDNMAPFAATLDRILDQQSVEIFVARTGGGRPPPSLQEVEEAIKYAVGFEDSATASPVVFEAVLYPYAGVQNAPAGLDAFVAQPLANLGSLIAATEAYLDAQGALAYVTDNADALGISGRPLANVRDSLRVLMSDRKLVDASFHRSDIGQIPNFTTLQVNHQPEFYQQLVDALNIGAASRLSYDQPFWLQWTVDGSFVSSQSGGFPTVADAPKVTLRIVQGTGQVVSGTRVSIETTESAMAETPRLAIADGKQDLVYEAVSYEMDKQTWILSKLSKSDNIVRFDDIIVLTSAASDGHEIEKNRAVEGGSHYLTTAKPTRGTSSSWKVKRPS